MREMYRIFLKPFDFRWKRCHKCGKRLFLQEIITYYETTGTEVRRYMCKNTNCTITAFEVMCERQELLHNLCSN